MSEIKPDYTKVGNYAICSRNKCPSFRWNSNYATNGFRCDAAKAPKDRLHFSGGYGWSKIPLCIGKGK